MRQPGLFDPILEPSTPAPAAPRQGLLCGTCGDFTLTDFFPRLSHFCALSLRDAGAGDVGCDWHSER